MYEHINVVFPPKMIRVGMELIGTKEKIGESSNPIILEWADECDISYSDDSIPWCGLFMAVVAKRSGWDVVNSPLWAKSWANFGQHVADGDAMFGDILVFTRNGGGHVGLYVAEDETAFHVLGGNQSDSVNITRISKDRLFAVRRPEWKIKQPNSVKKFFVTDNGELSKNEE